MKKHKESQESSRSKIMHNHEFAIERQSQVQLKDSDRVRMKKN